MSSNHSSQNSQSANTTTILDFMIVDSLGSEEKTFTKLVASEKNCKQWNTDEQNSKKLDLMASIDYEVLTIPRNYTPYKA